MQNYEKFFTPNNVRMPLCSLKERRLFLEILVSGMPFVGLG